MVANIYVSIIGHRESHDEGGYRKPQHHWMLSVEPHHRHVTGLGHKDSQPIHYAAARNAETGVYTIHIHEIHNESGLLGNILIAEEAHTSADDIHKILGEGSPLTVSANKSSEDEPEHWIRKAIRSMQQQQIVTSFDVGEFMTFAHGYVANRLDDEAPALVAYPKIHTNHEKTSSKHKFWLLHPIAAHSKSK